MGTCKLTCYFTTLTVLILYFVNLVILGYIQHVDKQTCFVVGCPSAQPLIESLHTRMKYKYGHSISCFVMGCKESEQFVSSIMKLEESILGLRSNIQSDVIPPEYLNHTNIEKNHLPIPVVDGRSLSIMKFYQNYVIPGIPVIIANYSSRMYKSGLWDLDKIHTICSDINRDRVVDLRQYNTDTKTTKAFTLTDFFSSLGRIPPNKNENNVTTTTTSTNSYMKNRNKYYLYDWSFTSFCSKGYGEITIPKWFVADYMQRLPSDKFQDFLYPYKLSPSFYIGGNGSEYAKKVSTTHFHQWISSLKGYFKSRSTFLLSTNQRVLMRWIFCLLTDHGF
eukprot:TRINITY_DN5450_c0_g1_i3.p1 TRINITY_DN5450_c0_g1~~TRINITY_DN5450_c0_g1_i3.p1  ORF type:complete len:335 (-),score=34.43 TRINITY_DN5450_c0_g1_i3:519-1523(-)